MVHFLKNLFFNLVSVVDVVGVWVMRYEFGCSDIVLFLLCFMCALVYA